MPSACSWLNPPPLLTACRKTTSACLCAPAWCMQTLTATVVRAQPTSPCEMIKAKTSGTSMPRSLTQCLQRAPAMRSAKVHGLCHDRRMHLLQALGSALCACFCTQSPAAPAHCAWSSSALALLRNVLHPTPPCAAFCTTDVAGYAFTSAKDSEGSDIGGQRSGMSAQQLAKLCTSTPGCVGFTSTGWLKSHIRPMTEWIPTLSRTVCDGLFVKGAGEKRGKWHYWCIWALSRSCSAAAAKMLDGCMLDMRCSPLQFRPVRTDQTPTASTAAPMAIA